MTEMTGAFRWSHTSRSLDDTQEGNDPGRSGTQGGFVVSGGWPNGSSLDELVLAYREVGGQQQVAHHVNKLTTAAGSIPTRAARASIPHAPLTTPKTRSRSCRSNSRLW